MADDLERRIDEVYSAPLDAFIPTRDALAKELKDAGRADDAKRVKAFHKPLVPAWAVNRLVRDDPGAIDGLLELGARLRSAQRRAISGGDVDELREALDERRRVVRDLTAGAMRILRETGTGTAAHEEEITATLEAAAADEEAGTAVRAGRLERPLRPPSGFGEGGGLRVLEGGRARPRKAPSQRAVPDRTTSRSARERSAEERARERGRRDERRRLERELALTEKREKTAAAAVEAARARIERIDEERAAAKDALRAAETDLRGATLERKRAAQALDRSG